MNISTWPEKMRNKVIAPDLLRAKTAEIRADNQTIATLNGSFDLLHAGHLQIIHEASTTADVLILALNSDSSIKKYKHPLRPIIPLEYRLQMISALEFVNYVTWFEETDPCQLLNIIKPNVHVNGAEYGENCIEAETVRRNGGRLHIVKLIPGLSTSMILKKITDLQI